MIFKIIPFVFAMNAIAALLVGASLYFIDKKRAQHSIWLVYNILFCIWNYGIYRACGSGSAYIARYWFMTSMAAMIFMPPVFLHFLSGYSDREVFRKQVLGKIYILFFLFFAASFVMPKEFIKGVSKASHLGYVPQPGLAFAIFAVVFFGFILCGFYYLSRASKLYLYFKRNQRMWLFLGMLMGVMAPLSFFFSVYGTNFITFGAFLVIPYLGIVSYTLLKFHAAELDILVNKTVVLSYFTLFVLLIHLFIVHVLHRIVGIDYFIATIISGGIVFVNLLFVAHYADLLRLNVTTKNIIYEKKLKYYKFLEEFSAISGKITDLEDLAGYIINSLVKTINVEKAALYLYDEDTKEFSLKAFEGIEDKAIRGIKAISADNVFVNFLKEGNVYVSQEAEDFSEEFNSKAIKESFGRMNLTLAVPLYYGLPIFHKRDMIGFLNLGKKIDKTPFNEEDMDILNAFGRHLSACVDKADLYKRAITDSLTKLYRIDYFNERLQEEIARAERYKRPFSLILIDLDNFKNVNDSYGHQKGDEALRTAAHVIKACVRTADVASRYGGEEFAILMPETSAENAKMGAERIRKAVEESFLKVALNITLSAGITEYKEGIRKYELIKQADEALYRAKSEGKNRVCVA